MKILCTSALFLAAALQLVAQSPKAPATESKATLPTAKRIVFLGDSITHAGQYLEFLETILLVETSYRPEVLPLGLSSETVSGLSEDGHAGGKFPRPDLHERLDRVLAKTKPNLVVACYGMNDGIYFPLKDDRFQAFKDGMVKLREKAKAAGAEVVHVTPPTFDPVPIKERVLPAGLKAYPQPFEGYNRVLDRYSEWLLSQREKGWQVIDIHGPMNEALRQRREVDPAFAFAKDGVHPNAEGHWVMTQQILKAWGVDSKITLDDLIKPEGNLNALYKLVAERQKVLKNAWLSECGHKRPGVAAGLPIDQALAKAADISKNIEELLRQRTKPGTSTAAASTPLSKPAAGTPAAPASAPALPAGTPALYPGKRSVWNGYDRYEFDVDGKTVSVVAPKQAAPGKPWVWHGEFFGHKPDPDIALLGKGFHIVYLKVPDMLGSPPAVQSWNALYAHLTKEYGFAKKVALVGLSRGGLYCYDWAIANPTKVACIYGDAPVCDFKSWPGGKGKGKGDPKNWARVMELWGFKDEAEALAYKGNPVDAIAPLAKNKVPLLHVYGDADDVVPPDENTLILAENYRKLGGTIELIAKAGVGHHPHGLQDSTPIVDFIARNAGK
jgi:lysophospholipase L1-like esterase/pimeloyl-ACP methyl ester carboxylesterase